MLVGLLILCFVCVALAGGAVVAVVRWERRVLAGLREEIRALTRAAQEAGVDYRSAPRRPLALVPPLRPPTPKLAPTTPPALRVGKCVVCGSDALVYRKAQHLHMRCPQCRIDRCCGPLSYERRTS
jgi:hypothetical protein